MFYAETHLHSFNNRLNLKKWTDEVLIKTQLRHSVAVTVSVCCALLKPSGFPPALLQWHQQPFITTFPTFSPFKLCLNGKCVQMTHSMISRTSRVTKFKLWIYKPVTGDKGRRFSLTARQQLQDEVSKLITMIKTRQKASLGHAAAEGTNWHVCNWRDSERAPQLLYEAPVSINRAPGLKKQDKKNNENNIHTNDSQKLH